MKWFKHDTDATADAKLKKLILKHGPIGYAVYFHCLELIAGDTDESNLTFILEHDSEIIADNLKIVGTADRSGVEIVESVMRHILALGLFEQSGEKIACFKLIKRLDSSMSSSPKFRNFVAKSRENHDLIMTESGLDHDSVMLEQNRIEQNRIEQNKTTSVLMSGKPDVDQPQSSKKPKFPIAEVLAYLNKTAHKNFKPVTANVKFVEARFREGASFEDFTRVIDLKVAQWYSDEKMAQYLRPETLFNASKFQAYLNESPPATTEQSQESERDRIRRLIG